jgi:hypothetical protein
MAKAGHLLHEAKEQDYTTLRQPWLNSARVLWIILSAIALIALISSTVRAWGAPLPACTVAGAACGPWTVSREDLALVQQAGLPVQALAAIPLATAVIVKFIFFLVGVFIFWRRSDDWIALLLSLMLTLFALEGVDNLGPWMPVVTVLYAVAALIFVLLPFVFPSGRFAPRWTQWVFWPLAIASMLATVLPQLGLPIDDRIYAISLISPFAVWFAVAVYAVIYRFTRISNVTERQQTKWVMAGFLGTFILFVPFILVTIFFPPSQPSPSRVLFMYLVYLPLYVFAYLCLPGGIAFAILRYRLYAIDVIIRRTLVYTTVTGLLALVYFGSIITLQAMFQSVTGERPAFVIVLSTLLIAALFTPLRRRIQAVIDRRFFRKKYVAQQVLAQFAITARDETDMNALTAELARVVQEAMEPESVTVWLKLNPNHMQGATPSSFLRRQQQ